jgi:hypothetical protein
MISYIRADLCGGYIFYEIKLCRYVHTGYTNLKFDIAEDSHFKRLFKFRGKYIHEGLKKSCELMKKKNFINAERQSLTGSKRWSTLDDFKKRFLGEEGAVKIWDLTIPANQQ